jgi:hypothetical protein
MKLTMLTLLFMIILGCESKKEYFEVSSVKTNFTYKETETSTRASYAEKFKAAKENREPIPETKYDVRYIDLTFDIKNLTGEKIETADLSVTVTPKYNSGNRILNFELENVLFDPNSTTWEVDEMKEISTRLWISELNDYDKNMFLHKPESINLTMYLKAKNSVGFSNFEKGGDLIYDQDIEINDWK